MNTMCILVCYVLYFTHFPFYLKFLECIVVFTAASEKHVIPEFYFFFIFTLMTLITDFSAEQRKLELQGCLPASEPRPSINDSVSRQLSIVFGYVE